MKNKTDEYSGNIESSTMSSEKLKIDQLGNMESKSETKNIINLNTDCMEIIFKHLELDDLINVADSSKRFYSTACEVYKLKFTNIRPVFAPDRR